MKSLRIGLITGMFGLSSWACHAQTALALFDTLNVRNDLSKPAITRFQAARYHATACMYNGRVAEQRSTALLLLDLANEMKQDTLLAHANVVVGYSFRQGGDPERALQYEYKGLEYAAVAPRTRSVGRRRRSASSSSNWSNTARPSIG